MRFFSALAIPAAMACVTLSPAFANQASSKEAQAANKERVVCKTKPRTGTRFATKTCHTVAEWDTIAEENRRQMEEMNGPAVNTTRGN